VCIGLASFTALSVGSVVSGLWFIAFRSQLVTVKSLNERIDEAVGEPLLDCIEKIILCMLFLIMYFLERLIFIVNGIVVFQ
jgi:hypothetical protein